jgi:PAS domain S-box-containing protein
MNQFFGLTQQRSGQLLNALPAVVFEYTISADGSRDFTYISPRCEEILGVSQEILLRGILPMKNFIHHEDWDTFYESTEESISTLNEWKWEGRIKNRGAIIWIEACGVPTRTEDGSVVCSGLISDITQRKRLEYRHHESERKYRELVEHLPVGVGIHAQGVLVYANKYALRMMGADDMDQIIGKSVLDLVHHDYRDLVVERMKLIKAGIEVPPVEEKFLRLDGKVIDVETSAYPFQHHGMPAIQIIVRDLTETKNALLSVKKVEKLFTQLFQNSPMAVVMLNEQGSVVQINSGFEDLFGYTNEELKGRGLNPYIVPEELESEGNDLNSLISTSQVIRIETVRKTKAGELLSVILYGVPVHMDDKTIGIFGVYVDITARKKVEEELKTRNTELDNFVYKVSHDLRAPLSSVLGLVNLANMPGNDDNPKTYMSIIGKKVEQLDHFISDVLSHSKNLKLDVKISQINLAQVIERTLADLSYLKGADEIQQHLDISGENFHSDPWRLAEIFRNLISNSIKYRRFDIENSWIRVSASITEESATIYFKDNGIGIDADKLPHIFSMFYRASTQSEGSGLGLYIVKNAVEKLDGTIEVSSEPLVGTQFKIILPNKGQSA